MVIFKSFLEVIGIGLGGFAFMFVLDCAFGFADKAFKWTRTKIKEETWDFELPSPQDLPELPKFKKKFKKTNKSKVKRGKK